MNKNTFLITISIIFLAINGCSVDKVNAPAPTTQASTPSTVQVTLSSSAIASSGSTQVTATVLDAASVPVPNVTVTFSVINALSGTFSPLTAVTDASGVATTMFTAAAVNTTATIRAAVTTGTSQISGSAPITIGSPPHIPTSVVVSLAPTSVPATGGNTTVTATVSDASGGIGGVAVSFSTSVAGAGLLSATTATTDASGVATVTYTANAGNTQVDIRATVGSLNNSATLHIGTPLPPVPASMTVVANPLSVNITSHTAVSVTLRDATGALAFSNPVTLTITGGTTLASFSTSSSVLSVNLTTDAAGVASAFVYAGASSGAVTITATSGSLPSQSVSFFITSDPAAISINIVKPNLINGQTTNITANVRNILNNPVTDGTVVNFSITSLPPFAGSLSASAASTVNGIASVTFTADPSVTGGVIIQASSGTVSPVQSIIIVNAAQAGSLEFISATPGIINIIGAGASSSAVKFKVISTAGVALANQSVNFQLSIAPFGATLDTGGGSTSSGSTDANGEVTTILHAGAVAGPVRIVATTAVTGPPAATLTASSGNISIGGGVPSDRFFSVAVSKFNIEGLACNDVQSTITAYLADRFGNYNILEGTSVSFATDAGAIDTSNVTDAVGLATALYRTQDPRPTDVTPIPGEPNYTVGGHTYNPRDGYFTVLVSTTGEEHFQDENANGVYDLGETFTDIPEPYIDSNDNGIHDAGELFFDWPLSVFGSTLGLYNNANGVWDARIPIFREVTLVMTGPPDIGPNTSHIVSGPTLTTAPVTIPRGSTATFYVYVSDINMNALIADTAISLTADDPAAVVKWVGGSEKLGGGVPFGPAITVYTVKNNNTSAPPVTVFPTISAMIDWPGTCGGVKVIFSYPGTVTLP